jgi:hypothetical protein
MPSRQISISLTAGSRFSIMYVYSYLKPKSQSRCVRNASSKSSGNSRQYWMVYWGPGFPSVVWFGSSPTPSPVSKLNCRHTGRLTKRDNFMTGEGGWGCDRSRTIPVQKSLVPYKSFKTLWVTVSLLRYFGRNLSYIATEATQNCNVSSLVYKGEQ